MSLLRIVQLGAGGWGAGWPEFINDSDDCELVMLWNRGEERLAGTKEQYGLDESVCTTDLDRALDADADAVLISTPHHTHVELGLKAVAAGKHLLVEKPLSDKWDDAVALVEAAEKAGTTFSVVQNFRYREEVWRVRELIRQGAVGAPDTLFATLSQGPYTVPEWRRVQRYPMLSEVGIHHFDMARFMTGCEPVSVECVSWKPRGCAYEHMPTSTSVFEFENNVRMVHNGNWGATGAFTNWDGEWRIQLENGTVFWDGEKLELTKNNDVVDEIPQVDGFPGFDRHGVLAEFAAAIREGREPLVNGREHLRSLAMAFAAMRSSDEGRRVELSEFGV